MAIDLIGPASDNAVTVRPARTINRLTADTWFKDCTSQDAQDGTSFGADFFNDTLAQLRVAMRSAGILIDNADDMLWRAMQSVGVRYGADTGAANQLTVDFTPEVLTLAAGLPLLVKVGTDNTGAVTLQADAQVAKDLKWPDGTALAAGDLKAGAVILVVYDGTRFQLLNRINGGSSGALAQFVPGQVIMWPLGTPPTGTLECDGSAVSRVTYERLFQIIGTTYGVGNGTTTFNLPDYRGEFMRGWDHGRGVDPDKATRTNRGDGATGDNIGTKQGDQLKSHNHSGTSANDLWKGAVGAVAGSDGLSVTFNQATEISPASITISSTGGLETRPRNVNILYCIAF